MLCVHRPAWRSASALPTIVERQATLAALEAQQVRLPLAAGLCICWRPVLVCTLHLAAPTTQKSDTSASEQLSPAVPL